MKTTKEERDELLDQWHNEGEVTDTCQGSSDIIDRLIDDVGEATALLKTTEKALDVAIEALETDGCWCSRKGTCYRCRALDRLRPIYERTSAFIKEPSE